MIPPRLLLAVALAAVAGGAQAETWRTFDDGRGGSITFSAEGVYQTFTDSLTLGPNGYSAQTYGDSLGGSTTFIGPGSRRDRGW